MHLAPIKQIQMISFGIVLDRPPMQCAVTKLAGPCCDSPDHSVSSRKLVATGRDSSGKRKTISASEWLDLWPMFATDRATGPDKVFTDVEVFEATSSETPQAQLSSDCIAWLKERKIAGVVGKKFALHEEARQRFGNGLTHAIFDAAYLAVFGRGRGRPKRK